MRTVVVDGWGLLAEELVAQLRRCDVPVRGGRYAADGAELALASWTSLPGAVVVVAEGRTPWWAGAPWQARGIPHLPVVLGAAGVVVGPLVLPGRTACLRCAGPGWPVSRVTEAGSVPLGTAVLAAAVATVTVLAALRGDPSLGGISTEIGLDEVSVTHRLWKVRPDCRCASARMAG
ncbi:MAG TPA: hypothetical protein VES93_16350 [Ornithinibacter sp.]|nr:hypothetical protein [Ornithinibacter sp.]